MSTLQTFKRVEPQTLRQILTKKVLVAIFERQLTPGQRLVVQALGRQFGVSATPVREALVELATTGLVELLPNRGAVVRSFGPKQLREIFHLRKILEEEATRCACAYIDKEKLRQLKDEFVELTRTQGANWSEREIAADEQLHHLIGCSCGNNRLAEEIRRYDLLLQALREVVGNQLDAQQEALSEHIQIIDAMLAGDADKAASAMTQHVERAASSIEAVVFKKDNNSQVRTGA